MYPGGAGLEGSMDSLVFGERGQRDNLHVVVASADPPTANNPRRTS
jgi:hypothetical protein